MKIIIFTAVKNRCILHGHVFVMTKTCIAPLFVTAADPGFKEGIHITKTSPCNLLQFFMAVKKDNFQKKNCHVFLIFAQNIDYGYT